MLVVDPLLVLGAVAGLLSAAALFVYPFLGALAYLVFEYASLPEMFPILRAVQIGKLIILSTTAAFALRLMISRDMHLVHDRITWVFLVWWMSALISISVALDTSMAIQGTIDLAKWMVVYLLLINLIDNFRRWQICLWTVLLLAFKMSQFQLRHYTIGLASTTDSDFFIREGLGAGDNSFFGNAGDFGVFMCVVAPLAFYIMKSAKPWVVKAVGAVLAGFFVLSVIKSGARGNIVSLACMGMLFWWRSRQKVMVGVSIVILALAYWITAPDVVRNRFAVVASDNPDGTTTHRLILWQAGFKMLLAQPLTGAGINNFNRTYLQRYAGNDGRGATAPHNLFIQCLSELGLVGLTALLTLIAMMFIRNAQTRKLLRKHSLTHDGMYSMSLALDLSLVGYLSAGCFLTVLYYPHLFFILIFIVTLHKVAAKWVEEQIALRGSEQSAIDQIETGSAKRIAE